MYLITLLLGAAAAGGVASEEPRTDSPDIEFLEYLGTLVFGGDEWVGPEDMGGPAATALPDDFNEMDGLGEGETQRTELHDDFERDLLGDPP